MKKIQGFENYYITTCGKVISLNKNGKPKILKPDNSARYYRVTIYDNDKKRCRFSIHRLVAMHYIDNYDNLPVVNHIDENTYNNAVCNLEWASYSDNNTHNDRHKKVGEKNKNGKLAKAVLKIDPITNAILEEYPSAKEAGRNGYSQGSISQCCRGEKQYYLGYIWKLKQEVLYGFKNEPKI